MTNQAHNLRQLRAELDSALTLIQNKNPSLANVEAPRTDLLAGTQSLLERCEQVVQQGKKKKPVIRVIHHLACSGGTLISKCIAALPNVFLLSEAHPNSTLVAKDKPRYSPSDIPALAKFAQIPNVDSLNKKLFIQNIKAVHEHIQASGGTLVVRYHTHSDYNVGSETPDHNVFKELMADIFDVKQVLTIRDPIDAFTSLKKNDWVHFNPDDFDEYCKRYLLHLSHFEDCEIFKYEDFVEQPSVILKKICDALDLPFEDSFEDTFGLFNVTGDSGRSSDVIGGRERLADHECVKLLSETQEYQKICENGWY